MLQKYTTRSALFLHMYIKERHKLTAASKFISPIGFRPNTMKTFTELFMCTDRITAASNASQWVIIQPKRGSAHLSSRSIRYCVLKIWYPECVINQIRWIFECIPWRIFRTRLQHRMNDPSWLYCENQYTVILFPGNMIKDDIPS